VRHHKWSERVLDALAGEKLELQKGRVRARMGDKGGRLLALSVLRDLLQVEQLVSPLRSLLFDCLMHGQQLAIDTRETTRQREMKNTHLL
jgi:hypothetical protein